MSQGVHILHFLTLELIIVEYLANISKLFLAIPLIWLWWAVFYLYKFLSYLWRGRNILAINLSFSRVPWHISIRSLNFLFSTNSFIFSLEISFLASLRCLFILLKVGSYGGLVMSTISMGSLIGTCFPFLWMGDITDTLSTMLSSFVDALVKRSLCLDLYISRWWR